MAILRYNDYMLRLGRSGSTLSVILIASVVTAGFVMLFLGISVLIMAGLGLHQLTRFSQISGYSITDLSQTIQTAWQATPTTTAGHTNFLILGIDELPTRGDTAVLSDSILIVSANLSTGQLNALSLPRDLWFPDYLTKINALYTYGRERNPNQPSDLATQVISDTTQVPLHHTIVISIDQLGSMVDLVGGIEIEVPEGFSDPLFPRPDVDVTTERDPAKLYQTVTFEAGNQILDGERTLQYVRSRKSAGDQGGDEARTKRQQQVITALLHKLTQPNTYFDLHRTALLAKYYRENFASQLPLVELIALAKTLYPHRSTLEFVGQTLSIFPDNPQGVLTHPPLTQYNGQWVYIDRALEKFRHEVTSKLSLSQN